MRQPFVADYSSSRTRNWRPAAVYVLLLGNFALLGITIGAQGVLWADLLGQLHISMGAFGSAQLVSPLISVALLLLGGQLATWAAKQRLAGASLLLLGGAMFVGRLTNAPLVERLGPRASLAISGVGLLLATLLLLIPGGVPLAIGAFVLLGLAVAGVVPTVLTTAARLAPGNSGAIAGAMLAAVYVSFMMTPPLIGWLAEFFSLQAALVTLGISGLGMLYLARGVERL